MDSLDFLFDNRAQIASQLTLPKIAVLRDALTTTAQIVAQKNFPKGSKVVFPAEVGGKKNDKKTKMMLGEVLCHDVKNAKVKLLDSDVTLSVPFELLLLPDAFTSDDNRNHKRKQMSCKTEGYKTEGELRRKPKRLKQESLKKTFQSRMSQDLTILPSIPTIPTTPLSSQDTKSRDMLALKKQKRYEKQIRDFREEVKSNRKCNEKHSRSWIPYQAIDEDSGDSSGFLYIREGNCAVKWFPQTGETLLLLSRALRERLRLSSKVDLCFRMGNSMDEHLIPPTTVGKTLKLGSVIDVVLPKGVIGRWSYKGRCK
jgi:hypothetical protein